MSGAVLDSSAVIALLLQEPGHDKVAAHLSDPRMSAVNLSEVIGHFVRGGLSSSDVSAMLRPLAITIADADEQAAQRAGELRAITSDAGLSLGDRFCIALALRDRVPVLTGDRQWATIADKIGVDVILIR